MLHEKLRCYREAIGLTEGLSKDVARWPRGYGYLVDQLRRAMASVVLNTAEGNARRGPTERRRFFEIARASAAEVAAVLDLACAFGLMTQSHHAKNKSRLSWIGRMLWGLMH